MTNEERDEQFEVVWEGKQPMLPPRESKRTVPYIHPPQLYNKKSDHWCKRCGFPKVHPFTKRHCKCVRGAEGK